MELSDVKKAVERLKDYVNSWWNGEQALPDQFSSKEECKRINNEVCKKIILAIREQLLVISDWLTNIDGKTSKPMTRSLLKEITNIMPDVKMIANIPKNKDMQAIIDWGGLLTLSDEVAKILDLYGYKESAETVTRPTKTPHQHFNRGDTKEHLTLIFERLKNSCYFDEKAKLDMWLYVCGVAPLQSEFEPLNWVKDNGLLAHLIESLFIEDSKYKWAIGVQCFTIKGEQPKVSTLKQLNSKGYKSDNKKHNELEKMLR